MERRGGDVFLLYFPCLKAGICSTLPSLNITSNQSPNRRMPTTNLEQWWEPLRGQGQTQVPRGRAYTDASVCVMTFSQPCFRFLTATLPQRGSSPKTKDLVKLINQLLGHQEKDRYRAPSGLPDFPLADSSRLSCVRESWSHPKGSNACLSIHPAVAAGTPCWQPTPTL